MSSIQIVPKSHETALQELDNALVPGTGAVEFGLIPGSGRYEANVPQLVPGSALLDAVSVPANNITYAELQDVVKLAEDITAEVTALRAERHLGPKKNAANFDTIAQRAADLTAFLKNRLVDKIPPMDKPKAAGSTATDISSLPAEMLGMILSKCRTKDLLAAQQVAQNWKTRVDDAAIQQDALAVVPNPQSHYWTPFAEPQFKDTRPLRIPRPGFDGQNGMGYTFYNRAEDPEDIKIREYYIYPFPGVEYNPISKWEPVVPTGVGRKVRIPAITDNTIRVEISIWPLVDTVTNHLRIGTRARTIQLAQPPITALRGFNSKDRTGITMLAQGMTPDLNIATGITIGDLYDDARLRILNWPGAARYTEMLHTHHSGYGGDDGFWVTYVGDVRLNATDPIMRNREVVARRAKAAKAKRRRQRVRRGDDDFDSADDATPESYRVNRGDVDDSGDEDNLTYPGGSY